MKNVTMDDFYGPEAPPPTAEVLTVLMHIETDPIDRRKHGRGFVRRLRENEFVEPTHIEWGRKCMTMFFDFTAQVGELLQVRLSDGSWKNDAKEYIRVRADGGWDVVPQSVAGPEIAAMKAARFV